MSSFYYIIVPFIVAFTAVLWIHPKILKIAVMKNIVDNPDARKLQRTPVPVLGGMAVFFGLVIGLCCSRVMFDYSDLFAVIGAMIIILYVGTMDDILNLSPLLRFAVEIALVLLIIFINRSSINDFHGLWGYHAIPDRLAVPLTVFAAVGIINAINLIDGVDGLSSGFCILASLLFCSLFFFAGDISRTVLAAASAGALIPFFFHNVFGKTSKMFIGDGGTLVMGIVMSTFVIDILKGHSLCAGFSEREIGLIPFTLAVLSVPVFDTLRVMSMRVLRGVSPFRPDKTHLHHLFIELGFSHVGTTVCILSSNLSVVLGWWLSYRLGASPDVQFYVVVALSVLITFGFYKFMKVQQARNTRLLHLVQRIGRVSRVEHQGIWLWLQKAIDRI